MIVDDITSIIGLVLTTIRTKMVCFNYNVKYDLVKKKYVNTDEVIGKKTTPKQTPSYGGNTQVSLKVPI